MLSYLRSMPLKEKLVSVALVCLVFLGGMFFGASRTGLLAAAAAYGSVAPANAPGDVDFTPVWRAWQAIDERYVPGKISTSTATTSPTGFEDSQERVWGMIQGLAGSLNDPYTVFMPPAEAEIFEDDISGSFEGVGMEIAVRNNLLVVVSPLKDTPAYRAGLKAADYLAKIDGRDTKGIDVNQAVKLIRGKKGTTVTFTVYREGADGPMEVKVVRDVINIPTIKTEKRTDGIFVIALYNFSAVSAEKFRDALQEFVDSGGERLIVDLRGNPGGYLGAAVDMASWFLPSGKVIVTEDHGTRGEPIVHRSLGYNVFNEKLKLVILVDRGSASASEILARALQFHGKATLIGTNTFGKGSVQELVPITPETSLKLTVARWLSPDGLQIPDTGVTPDIEVKVSEDDVKAGKDPQLERAVAELLKRK